MPPRSGRGSPTTFRWTTRGSERRAPRHARLDVDLAQLLQSRAQCLAAGEHGLEQVTPLLDPIARLAHPETARGQVLCQLLPAKWCRDRCARLRPDGVDGGDRLPARVLAVVDEHALTLVLQPFGGGQAWVPLLEPARHALGERIGLIEGGSARNRDE